MPNKICQICFEGELHRESRNVSYDFRGHSITIKQSGDWCDQCGEGILNGDDLESTSGEIDKFKKSVKFKLADLLKQIRLKLNLTQQDSAKICGGTVDSFSRYEKGEIAPPLATVNLMKLLANHPELLDEIQHAA